MTSSWEIHHFPGCYCPNKVSCSSVSGDTSHLQWLSPHWWVSSVCACPHCLVCPGLVRSFGFGLWPRPPSVYHPQVWTKKTQVLTLGLASTDKWIIKLFPLGLPCLQLALKTSAPLCFWAHEGARRRNMQRPSLKWLFLQPEFLLTGGFTLNSLSRPKNWTYT